jgi:hypothetical protein
MEIVTSISELPREAAVYAMYGGRGQSRYVAYVGVAGSLKSRIIQHLINRDSSVTTGMGAVRLQPEHVSEVRCWTHSEFERREFLEAAELVAFDVLNPILRSRGGTRSDSGELYKAKEFQSELRTLFAEEPAGRLTLPTLITALERIAELETRMNDLEQELKRYKSNKKQ